MCCGCLVCCLGICGANCCCSSLRDCNIKKGAASRIPYIFIMFIFSIFAIVMSLYGEEALYSNHILHFKLSLCNSSTCAGNGSVYRTSFSLFIFFLIHVIVIMFIMSFHWILFGIKLIFLIGFLIATFWISNSFFDGYANFARVASIFFLVFQVMVLISWAWDINEGVVNKIDKLEEEKESKNNECNNEKKINCELLLYKSLLMLATLILFVAIIILFIFMYKWFDKDSCYLNEALISITVVLVAITITLPPILQTGSIFTATVVSFYMTYLCYNGLSSFPKEKCNPFANQRDTINLWIGIIITVGAISYIGCGASKHKILFPEEYKKAKEIKKNEEDDIELQIPDKKQKTCENENENDNDNENEEFKKKDTNNCDSNSKSSKNPEESKQDFEKKSNILFHICMAFSAIYMSMLFTNWGTNVLSSKQAITRGKISLWVNIASEWITFILYIWTVVAPKVCPQRFAIENVD